jgi:hypothetical protein
MRINYEFLTGERLEIEVDENIGEVIIEMEKMQSRRNRAETRRHNSLEFMQENRDGYLDFMLRVLQCIKVFENGELLVVFLDGAEVECK